MAAAVSWCKFLKAKGICQAVGKSYYSTHLARKEGVLDRMKKYIFGEEAPLKEMQDQSEDSYFQLHKHHELPIYSMETHEIVDKLESIVMEAIPGAGQNWQNGSVGEIVAKYKVLSKCHKEFGLLVPNYLLSEMNSVGDVIQFYTSAKPEDTRTFKSIDMDNLPPNLTIGGTVPKKIVSR